jgi:hypothetical protein
VRGEYYAKRRIERTRNRQVDDAALAAAL